MSKGTELESKNGAPVTSVPNSLERAASWAWRLLVVGLAVVLAALALYELRVVTVPMFVALLISTLLTPPARWLQTRGLGAGLATGITFAGFIAIIAFVIYLLIGPLFSQFQDMGPQISKSLDNIQNWLKTGPLQLTDNEISDYIAKARQSISENSATLQHGLTQGATLVGETVVGILLALVTTFFFTKDGAHLVDVTVRRFPASRHEVLHGAFSKGYLALGGYLRGVAMTGVVDAVFIGIGLALLGVPFVAPLMLLTFFGAFIPVVGATVAGILAVLVALVSVGYVKALIVVAIVFGVQQIESHLLQPLLVGRAVSLHPLVILFSVAAGSIIAGILGAFLAVPIVAVVTAVVREFDRVHELEVDEVDVAD